MAAYLLKKGSNRQKKQAKVLQVLFERFFVDNVEYPADIEGCKYEPHISRGMFDSPFGHDIIKAPLPFDNSERVFHNGLSPSVGFFVGLDP